MAKHEGVYNLAQDWIRWLNTRRFFCQPEQKNILAKLQKEQSPSRGEPDGEMNAEMAAFNLAVTSLPKEQFIPFVFVYCDYRPFPVKVMAHEIGIGRRTFYENSDKAAAEVLFITRKLVDLHNQMRSELCGMI